MRIFSCFNTFGFKLGGVESYYIRMYEWAKSKQFKLFFYMSEEGEIQKEWLHDFERLGISIIYFEKMGKKVRSKNDVEHFFDDIEEGSLCITDSFETFMSANEIFRKQGTKVSILFYVLHPHATQLCKKRILNYLLAERILQKIEQKHLVFMDEETKDYASKYYENVDFNKTKIIRLGMTVPSFNLKERKAAYHRKLFTILTIARFDFPFKGYINGLIDTYLDLKRKFSNIELIIIGDGEGRIEIEKKIANISDNNIASGIHMLGYIPYDEIGKYMRLTNVFVGMGTTILDSAKYGVPGIVATSYQNEDYTAGFFHSDYTCIGKLMDEDGAKKYHFGELIEKIYHISEDDYLNICENTYNLLKKHYGIESCMAQVVSINAKKKIKYSYGISFFYNCMLPLWIKLKGVKEK